MICQAGCVDDTSKFDTVICTKNSRDKLIGKANNHGIKENFEEIVKVDLNSFSMHR